MVVAGKDVVANLIQEWRPKLLLQGWEINVEYMGMDKDGRSSSDPDRPSADVNPDPVYMKAHIRIYPRFFELDEHQQRECIVHELVHCHTCSLANIALNFLDGEFTDKGTITAEYEQLTQKMTLMILGDV